MLSGASVVGDASRLACFLTCDAGMGETRLCSGKILTIPFPPGRFEEGQGSSMDSARRFAQNLGSKIPKGECGGRRL
jgi:hypothetical protein